MKKHDITIESVKVRVGRGARPHPLDIYLVSIPQRREETGFQMKVF